MLILGWGDSAFMSMLLRELDRGPAALPRGSELTLFNSREGLLGSIRDRAQLEALSVLHVQGNPLDQDDLRAKLDISKCAPPGALPAHLCSWALPGLLHWPKRPARNLGLWVVAAGRLASAPDCLTLHLHSCPCCHSVWRTHQGLGSCWESLSVSMQKMWYLRCCCRFPFLITHLQHAWGTGIS